MSDDEEIVLKSNDLLYSHLIGEGYTDFETHSSENIICFNNSHNNTSKVSNKPNDSSIHSNDRIVVSSHDSDILQYILSCQLLFKEDADILRGVVSNFNVEQSKTRRKLYFYFGATLTCLFSTLVTLKKGMNIWLSGGATLLTTTCTSWILFKEYQEIHNIKVLKMHIGTLQKMCSSVHRLLRYLKETEILSTDQVSIHNIGAAMYLPNKMNEMKDLGVLPTWKTLPHVRKYLMDALLEIINILSLSCDSLRQLAPSWLTEDDQISLRESLTSNGVLSSADQTLTIRNLQLINEVYLVVQSEYLRRMAINISPIVRSSIHLKDSVKKQTFKIILDVQTKVTDITYKLKMQNSFHNLFSRCDKISENQIDLTKTCVKEISGIKVEVHNIFLLILSLLFKIRSLEDYLENLLDTDNLSSKTKVAEQLTALRDELASAVKCYDTIFYQVWNKNKAYVQGSDQLTTFSEPKSKETGIVVGASDFNVNAPDDIFLAISGLGMENYNDRFDLDEWSSEKPQIPKTLLTELSKTLKSRKKEFKIRERLAIERKGLQDTEHLSDISDTECETSHVKDNNSIRSNRGSKISETKDIHSSDSDDENVVYKRRIVSARRREYKTQESGSVSESEISGPDEDINLGSNLPNASALANLAALKSQQWRQTSEECFSDG